jgi:hypothetical protein
MSDSDLEGNQLVSRTDLPAYERPVVKPLGNARDILAGGFGSIADAPPDEIDPNRSGVGG